MEQKKLSQIFEEEFSKWTSLKVFWICLAVMVAGFLALCATVFYLDNGSAAKVLSGKEQLMANVWGRVFAVIAVMPVVIILFMFGFAALMGGLSVIAEKKKRKQSAKLGLAQIQEQSKDNEVAAPEQPAQVEQQEPKATEQEQNVPVAQAEESPAQPEPIAQEPAAEQAETVESEEAQEEEAPAAQAETVECEEEQKEETPKAQIEESPVQPEQTAQEPVAEQAEAAESETELQSKEVAESEDAEEETKRPHVRGEDHGKAMEVKIDKDRFHSVFKLFFTRYNAGSDSCSYDMLVRALEGRSWTKSDLARVALLIHESDILTGNRKYFNKWLVEFFEIMGRDDLPKTKTVSEFHDLSESSVKFHQVFNDLVYTYYAKTEKTTLKFDVPISK